MQVGTSGSNLRNLAPVQSHIVSSDGDAERPLEQLTSQRVSRLECDRRLFHFVAAGTPALVTDPRGPKASNVGNMARCRSGVYRENESVQSCQTEHTQGIQGKAYEGQCSGTLG